MRRQATELTSTSTDNTASTMTTMMMTTVEPTSIPIASKSIAFTQDNAIIDESFDQVRLFNIVLIV